MQGQGTHGMHGKLVVSTAVCMRAGLAGASIMCAWLAPVRAWSNS